MKIITFSLLILISMNVSAGCFLNGQEHPTGAVVDGYTCGADGYWHK